MLTALAVAPSPDRPGKADTGNGLHCRLTWRKRAESGEAGVNARSVGGCVIAWAHELISASSAGTADPQRARASRIGDRYYVEKQLTVEFL